MHWALTIIQELPMKIFFVSHSSVIPTYREKLRILCRHKDVELTLLLPNAWPEAGKRVQTDNQPKNKEGFGIISAPLIFEGRIKRHFYPSFSRIVEQVQPDIIHVEEEPYSLVAWQAARAARKLGAKLVFFTWENLLENFGFPHQWIRSYVLKTAAHAIAGDIEAGQLLQKAGYPASGISVIPQYGVNPKLFKKTNSSSLRKKLGLGSFTVGYLGRLVPEKGLHHLLEAFARLAYPKANLLIVGNGPLRPELGKKADQLGIAAQIRWVGALDQPQVPDYLNCMDVLVLPSLTTPTWKEQFGRVLIEAQACGVPVIGSDSGAIPEVIGKGGMIFKEGDIENLGEKLGKLARSANLRNKLAALGRHQALELYTNQRIADQIYRIYKNLTGGKPSS